MRLAKWQGLGNDYLIIEETALPGPLSKAVIGALCDRHRGVGADGILLSGEPTGTISGAVARMRVFNPDGSESAMCGNGIRMFALYLLREGAAAASEFVVETLAGPMKPRLLADGRVRVDMGRARFSSESLDPSALSTDGPLDIRGLAAKKVLDADAEVEGTDDDTDAVDRSLEAAGKVYHFTFVDVGNPHCVVLVSDPESFDVAGVGQIIEHHAAFPNRVNVEFVHVEDDGSARMRVWERGVGETQACGTGATAVGAALVRLGLATSPVLVHLPGGDLNIEVETDGQVFMTGPAEEVFRGELSPDLLRRIGWSTAEDG